MSSSNGNRVLVVGAGVIGLSTALCLRRQGLDVTLIAENFSPHVTSVVAGALWEWPPSVYGNHYDHRSLIRSKVWSSISYKAFEGLARNADSGVYMKKVTYYFQEPIADNSTQFRKMYELMEQVEEFVHDFGLINVNGVNAASGVQDAYSYLAPTIDTDVYLPWLLQRLRALGSEVIQKRISGGLRDQEETLKNQFHVDAIVNCAGLGSAELATDEMQPLRGALIRVRNDGMRFPRITQAHCVSNLGSTGESGFIYIVPRGRDMLVLGGLAEFEQWSLDVGLHNHEPIRKMYQRCLNFLPILKYAEIDPIEPVRVGLRPFRKNEVRLEREPGTGIIHNYGHCGAGVTLSWGCALEAAEITRKLLLERPGK